MVVAVGALYARYSGLAVVQSLVYGIAPAVMAIITIAAVKLLRLTNRRDWRLCTISAVVFAVTAATGSEPVLLIIAADPRLRRPIRTANPPPLNPCHSRPPLRSAPQPAAAP
jgi:hypothetical protein